MGQTITVNNINREPQNVLLEENDIHDDDKSFSKITKHEIEKAINNLKNGKAFANDLIQNEYLKSTVTHL